MLDGPESERYWRGASRATSFWCSVSVHFVVIVILCALTPLLCQRVVVRRADVPSLQLSIRQSSPRSVQAATPLRMPQIPAVAQLSKLNAVSSPAAVRQLPTVRQGRQNGGHQDRLIRSARSLSADQVASVAPLRRQTEPVTQPRYVIAVATPVPALRELRRTLSAGVPNEPVPDERSQTSPPDPSVEYYTEVRDFDTRGLLTEAQFLADTYRPAFQHFARAIDHERAAIEAKSRGDMIAYNSNHEKARRSAKLAFAGVKRELDECIADGVAGRTKKSFEGSLYCTLAECSALMDEDEACIRFLKLQLKHPYTPPNRFDTSYEALCWWKAATILVAQQKWTTAELVLDEILRKDSLCAVEGFRRPGSIPWEYFYQKITCSQFRAYVARAQHQDAKARQWEQEVAAAWNEMPSNGRSFDLSCFRILRQAGISIERPKLSI